MTYTVKNFKTKKLLNEALAKGEEIRCYQSGLGPDLSDYTGTVCLEGPHYPKPHTWYARATLENGIVTKVQ